MIAKLMRSTRTHTHTHTLHFGSFFSFFKMQMWCRDPWWKHNLNYNIPTTTQVRGSCPDKFRYGGKRGMGNLEADASNNDTRYKQTCNPFSLQTQRQTQRELGRLWHQFHQNSHEMRHFLLIWGGWSEAEWKWVGVSGGKNNCSPKKVMLGTQLLRFSDCHHSCGSQTPPLSSCVIGWDCGFLGFFLWFLGWSGSRCGGKIPSRTKRF